MTMNEEKAKRIEFVCYHGSRAVPEDATEQQLADIDSVKRRYAELKSNGIDFTTAATQARLEFIARVLDTRIYKKITTGFVVQEYEGTRPVRQEFIAGDQVDYEDEHGEDIEPPGDERYLPFAMVQPDYEPNEENIRGIKDRLDAVKDRQAEVEVVLHPAPITCPECQTATFQAHQCSNCGYADLCECGEEGCTGEHLPQQGDSCPECSNVLQLHGSGRLLCTGCGWTA